MDSYFYFFLDWSDVTWFEAPHNNKNTDLQNVLADWSECPWKSFFILTRSLFFSTGKCMLSCNSKLVRDKCQENLDG